MASFRANFFFKKPVPAKLANTKNGDPAGDTHLDLRAELQRRRGHRYEVITLSKAVVNKIIS